MRELMQALLESFNKEKGFLALHALSENALLLHWDGKHYTVEAKADDISKLSVFLKMDFSFVQSPPASVDEHFQKVWTVGLNDYLDRVSKAGNADLLPDCMKRALLNRFLTFGAQAN